jgi:Zn-dependent protease with chaperone function
VDKLKYYILLPILALLSTIALYLLLVFLSYKALSNFPLGEELTWRFLFADNSLIIAKNSKYQYVQAIVDSLPLDISNNPHKIKILIKEDNYVNAFAAPGNRIILTTGLLKAIKSENALLFVISHEIGHLARKEHLRDLSRMLISRYCGFLTRSNLFSEALMLIDTAKIKEVEFLVDIVALKIMLHHYGHVGGIDEFFQVLLLQDNNKALKYTASTHPQVRKRLYKINEIIKKQFLIKEKTIKLR